MVGDALRGRGIFEGGLISFGNAPGRKASTGGDAASSASSRTCVWTKQI